MDTSDNIARVRLRADESGIPRTVVLVRSTFLDQISIKRQQWDIPIVIFGSDREAEIQAISTIKFDEKPPLYVGDLKDFSYRVTKVYPNKAVVDLFDFAYRPNSSPLYRSGEKLVSSPVTKNDLLSLAETGPFSQHDLYVIEDYIADLCDDLERFCKSTAIRIKWGHRSLLPALVTSVWLERPRQFPLIIESSRELLSRNDRWENYESAKIVFSDFCQELSVAFGATVDVVVEAYKVWQLSRGNEESKSIATIPASISFSNAQKFLVVFAGAQIKIPSVFAHQVAAPIIFDTSEGSISLDKRLSSSDSTSVTNRVADKIQKIVSRLRHEKTLINTCPSADDILSDIYNDLEIIKSGSADDGIIVGLGIQINALQWNIDSTKENIGDATLGELVGLFSSSEIFLRRFNSWREYAGLKKISSNDDIGYQYRLARSLLRSASSESNLMVDEAKSRISNVLHDTSTETSPPSVLEGVVRSGDNLAAVALNSASSLVVKEARQFGGIVKKEVYTQGSKAAVKFVQENSDDIIKLSKVREWPWASWAMKLIRQLPDLDSL